MLWIAKGPAPILLRVNVRLASGAGSFYLDAFDELGDVVATDETPAGKLGEASYKLTIKRRTSMILTITATQIQGGDEADVRIEVVQDGAIRPCYGANDKVANKRNSGYESMSAGKIKLNQTRDIGQIAITL